MADDFQLITKKLSSVLGAVGAMVAILAVIPISGWVIVRMNGMQPSAWAAGVFIAIFAFGILHLVASDRAHSRWAIQMAITLATVWLTLAAALAVAGILFVDEGGLAALVPAAIMAWGGVGGLRVARRALESLDADEGWNNDEPPKPKGFEPIIHHKQ